MLNGLSAFILALLLLHVKYLAFKCIKVGSICLFLTMPKEYKNNGMINKSNPMFVILVGCTNER